MSDSGFIVVRSDDGRFMDSTGCWRREYPEANVFPSLGDARTSVRKTFKGASRAEAGGTGRAHWQAPVRRNEAQGRALITTQERDMGQITEDFILRAMRQCQLGRHPPMTVWEVRQLLTAWVEWQACREDAERYRWLRGQDWIDDSIMNEYLIAPEIPSTLDRAIDAERKRRASLPTGDV